MVKQCVFVFVLQSSAYGQHHAQDMSHQQKEKKKNSALQFPPHRIVSYSQQWFHSRPKQKVLFTVPGHGLPWVPFMLHVQQKDELLPPFLLVLHGVLMLQKVSQYHGA